MKNLLGLSISGKMVSLRIISNITILRA